MDLLTIRSVELNENYMKMILVNPLQKYHFWDQRKPKYLEKAPKNGINIIGLFWPSKLFHQLQEYVFFTIFEDNL